MEGRLELDGEVYFQDLLRVEGRVKAIGIDAEEFFRQSENFGQEELTDNNIEGKMDASLWIQTCLLYTSPSPRDKQKSRMP